MNMLALASRCRSASFALYKINTIRPYIDKGTTDRLVHALVMCYIDYCNRLLYGLPGNQLQKLQVIQNARCCKACDKDQKT